MSGSITAALRYGRSAVTDEMYADEIAAVLGYLGADPGWLGSLAGFMLSPWLLASSESGLRLATRFGLPLSFAHHVNPAGTESALAIYRSEFRPSRWLDRSYVMVGVITICADTDERANDLARPFDVLLTQFPAGESAALLPVPEAAECQFTGEQEPRLQATGPAGP